MAIISRPVKTAGFTEYVQEVAAGEPHIFAAEVDADLDTIYGEFNGGISDANVSPGAAIAGTKINLTTLPAHIVTTAAINPGATSAQILQTFAPAGGNITTPATLVSRAITTRGGPVRIFAVYSGSIVAANEAADTVLTLRLQRGGVNLLYAGAGTDAVFTQASSRAAGAGVGPETPASMTIPFIDVVAAGTYTYSLQGERTNGNGNISLGPCVLILEEAA